MDSEGKLYESNMKFDIGVKIAQLTIFVLKVSRMATKMWRDSDGNDLVASNG